MVEYVSMVWIRTIVIACRATLEPIVKQILMIAWQTHAETVVHVLIWWTVTNVSARFHTLDEIVTINWIHANQTVVIMVPNAHPVQIIKTFRAAVHLAIRDAYVIKISMNVRYHHRAVMEPLAKIYPVHISVCVQMDTKVEIVR